MSIKLCDNKHNESFNEQGNVTEDDIMHIYIISLMYFINHLLHCYCHHPEVVAALLDPQALQTL